jgi:hypothetical protein
LEELKFGGPQADIQQLIAKSYVKTDREVIEKDLRRGELGEIPTSFSYVIRRLYCSDCSGSIKGNTRCY